MLEGRYKRLLFRACPSDVPAYICMGEGVTVPACSFLLLSVGTSAGGHYLPPPS